MAISAKYYINYSASASPIEELSGVNSDDGTDKTRITHSDIDKSVGGGKEIDCGATSTSVRYIDYTTTDADVHINTITSATITGIDFIMVKVRESVDSDGDCDCILTLGSQVASKMLKVGDCVMLRPSAIAGDSVKFKSTAGKLSKVDILLGLEG